MKFTSAFFAKNLKNWRESFNESQLEFAERFESLNELAAKRAVISSYENESSVPRLDFIFEFSTKTGYTMDALFSKEIDFSKSPDLASDSEESTSYQKSDDARLKALQEKLDALWALNMHRAEKMEAWELELQKMKAELDRAKAEIAALKGGKG